ncbi:MAG: hypothetical protein MSA13_02655 [Prevotella sp.]|nr:hypothetical protein [Prevotella sp.]
MDNNQQTTQETPQAESPKNQPQKARTSRKTAAKQTADKGETTKKTLRKPRSAKAVKTAKKSEETKVTESVTAEIAAATEAEQTQIAVPQQEEKPLSERQEEQNTPQNTSEQAESTRQANAKQEQKVPPLPSIQIRNIVELMQAPMRNIVLTDQQIQQLTLQEIDKRHRFLEETLVSVLDYDVVISDTNIWLELLVGYTSSHSDPRYNARLQFERQLEFISKLTQYRGGRFIMMGETYEEIDRFASMQDPANHRDADFTDNIVCLNTAARLAKRLILAQQRENRLRIDGIGAESHHASFADPAIIRKVVDLFAAGKKVLLLTNDASVAIRTMGICDDLQRHNNISDEVWDERYAPLRPMVFTFDDLKQLDFYTRQYHYIQMAAGAQWMQDIEPKIRRERPEALTLWLEAFRPGDKHRNDNLFTETEKQQVQKQQQQRKQQEQQSRQQEQKKKQVQQKQQQQRKQQEQADLQKSDNAPAPVKEEPVAAPVSVPPEPKDNDTVAGNDKKNETKQGSRTRRKPQRTRKSNAEKTVETPEKADKV